MAWVTPIEDTDHYAGQKWLQEIVPKFITCLVIEEEIPIFDRFLLGKGKTKKKKKQKHSEE